MKPLLGIGILLLALGLTYCRQETPITYLPTKSQLRAGIYNKYYLHYQPKDPNRRASIDISYLGLECRNEKQELTLTFYTPAFEPTRKQRVQCAADEWKLLDEEHYFYNGDSGQVDLSGHTLFRITSDSSSRISNLAYPNDVHFFEQTEFLPGRDTTIDNRPAWIACSKGYRIVSYPEDTVRTDWTAEQVIVQGIGLYSRIMDTEDYSYKWELMEQIPQTAFHRLAREKPQRVAYINPQEALEGATDFQTCGSTDKIIDYYNGEPDGRPKGEKPALEKAVLDHWDPSYFTDQNGYLTLRFVINCKGEIGRFTLESADLDFQPTTFPTPAVNHCMEILQQVGEWQPTVLRGEAMDAYAYVTFKLRDGELIKILP